jgi:tRNA uridine 5-carboxymethylaminomethyl modification enzyme
MFTARAEYRILLRQDNADERLTEKGYDLGLADRERITKLGKKREMVGEIIDFLKSESLDPEEINDFLETSGTSSIRQKVKAVNIATRPQISLKSLLELITEDNPLKGVIAENYREIIESAEIRIKYEGYIQREKIIADKIKRLESLKIPEDINYSELLSISTEGRQKLTRIKPENIGQAGRISGVSPSDLNILLLYMGR